MASYPFCTITVYLNGTLTPATIFSDNAGTPKANPFTADAKGFWFFYAANGRYDVRLSGGGLPAPFTLADYSLSNSSSSSLPFFLASDYATVQLALNACAAAGGGTVLLSPATVTFSAAISATSNCWLKGSGTASRLQLAANAWPASQAGPFYCVNSFTPLLGAICTADNASNIQFQDFVLDMNGANQVNTTPGNDFYLVNCKDCGTSNVQILNSRHIGAAIWAVGPNTKNSVHSHDIIHGYGTAPCTGGIGIWDGLIEWSYADGTCDSNFIANGGTGSPTDANVVIAHNVAINGTAAAASASYTNESTPHAHFIGNKCTGPANSGCYSVNATAGPGSIITTELIDNTCDSNPSGAPTYCLVTLSSPTYTIGHLGLSENKFRNSSNNCIQLQGSNASPAVLSASLSGDYVKGCGNVGIFVYQGVTKTQVTNEHITGTTAYGILVNATGTSLIGIGHNVVTATGGTSIVDASGTATILPNITDDFVNGLTTVNPISVQTLSLVNGANQNIPTIVGNFNPGVVYYRVAGPSGAFSIGGFANTATGKEIHLTNGSGQTMTITNLDAGSSALNQIVVPGGGNLAPVRGAILIWDVTQNKWTVESFY